MLLNNFLTHFSYKYLKNNNKQIKFMCGVTNKIYN